MNFLLWNVWELIDPSQKLSIYLACQLISGLDLICLEEIKISSFLL